jgi:hypothetical protein
MLHALTILHQARLMITFGRVHFISPMRMHFLTQTTADQKFTNLHGERAARLNSGQSIFKPKEQTWFIKILSPVFLFAPGVYLQRLHNVSIDHVVNHRAWKEMLSQLTEEWREFTLLVSTYSM